MKSATAQLAPRHSATLSLITLHAYTECCYAGCHLCCGILKSITLSVVMLSVWGP
jgi:hypothetical protein